ncbi:MAG TPA: bifunctional diguanylate cyclase/phosphodiesterase [Acidimicrobiales bacterium]|nr:bifunctional diguanylate cyclase/phosphodiesterase [Acidimicrobiales bacterium]
MRSGDRQSNGDATTHLDAPDAQVDDGRDSRQTHLLRARLVSVLGLCIVGLIFAIARSLGTPFGEPWLLVPFIAVQAASWAVASKLQPSDSKFVQQFDEAVFVASWLLLPSAGVVLVLGAGTALGLIALRNFPRTVCINGSILTVAALGGVCAADAVSQILGGDAWGLLAGACIGSVALAVINESLLAMCFRFVLNDPFWSSVTEFLRFRVRRAPFLIAIGFLAGSAAQYATWIVALAVPLLGGLQYVLAEHTRARRDLDRTQGLFESSVEVHGHVDVREVEQELAAAAARLLRCTVARVAELPPGDDEWGASLRQAGGSDRWLIVAEPTSRLPLDAEALRLLSALAAIGSSALENAELVEEIRRAGLVDALTGLSNHVLFEDRVAQAAATARRNRERFAVMMFDLDHFKKINDSLGHSMGNEMLRLVADRLKGAARDIDTVARLGSDHFILLLPGVGNSDAVGAIAERLLAAVRRPMNLGGHELFMTASAGVAFFPEDGTRAEHLLRNADSAMHRAKDLGRDTFKTYASGMNDLAQLRLVRESELHNAVQRDELRLRFQPQIDLRTGRILGVEALVRWEHPTLGLIGPGEFVPLAEESGLIVAVDIWVLNEACRQAKAWLDQGLPEVRMAVNISGRHFHASDRLIEAVERALSMTGLPAHLLELEVTEGIAIGEVDATARALNQIRDLGVRLAIDDFGTGYSMLGRLRSFPIDRLKIDRSFVSEIESHLDDAPIVSAMIAMARSLHIECVAEGVETLDQQIYLRNHLCDQAQGFLYCHPVEPDEIARLLQTPSVGYNLKVVSSATSLGA